MDQRWSAMDAYISKGMMMGVLAGFIENPSSLWMHGHDCTVK